MKIGIIGGGNIGGAIVNGLAADSSIDNSNLYISDLSQTRLDELQHLNKGINAGTSNIEVVKHADLIVLAVKPWLVGTVVNEIKQHINYNNQLVVSVAAGVDFSQLVTFFNKNGHETPVLFRMIPNTAIAIGKGVLTLSHNNASIEQVEVVKELFSKLGNVFVVAESQLNAFMSLSSCGIAYAFRYIRAAVEGAVEMGINANLAQQVVAQTLIGAAELLTQNASHPEAEIDKVTTPGGITIKGLNEMEAYGFTNSVIKGLKASLIK